MQNIFWGTVFLLLNVSISAGASVINLFPCFVGYILLAKGLAAFRGKSLYFEKIKPFCTIMISYELVVWTIDICALGNNVAAVFTQGISSAAVVFVLYHITRGIADIQKNASVDLRSETLCKHWGYFVITCMALYVLSTIFTEYSVVLMILSNVFSCCFLSDIYKTKNKYYDNL